MNARVCYSIEWKYVSPFYILVSPYGRKYAKNRIKNEHTVGQEQRFEGFRNLTLSSLARQIHWGKRRQRTCAA